MLKYGFRQAPTDYYLRPYWLSLYESSSYEPTRYSFNEKPCYFDKLLHKVSFDWLKDLEQMYLSNKNASKIARFGVIKLNEMSHDHLDRLFWIDDDLEQLLTSLFTPKFMNDTLFILMGDHGHRFHKIRQTFIGKLEVKLPMFGMVIPKRLLDKNEIIRTNLRKNTKIQIHFQCF